MTIPELIAHRLSNQQLTGTTLDTPADVACHFGAMQAQDYAMSKWAIGIRSGAKEAIVEHAINSGKIVRTHVLRPTWHLVAASDVRWMLQLTAPRIKATFAHMSRRLELDAKLFDRCNAIIARALSGKQLTRAEIMQALEQKKIPTDELRSTLIMMNAELDGIVCNGAMRGKQFTYALLDEKIPIVKSLTKQEALAELAKRYFTSHGPATLHDFSWWSGLSVTDAKAGLENIKHLLNATTIADKTYWFKNEFPANTGILKNIYFLPAYDEFMVSYKDRSASLDPVVAKDTITGNGIFRPIVVINGKVAGTWKRTVKNNSITIEVQYFNTVKKAQVPAIKNAAKQYADFTGKSLMMTETK